MKEHFSKLNPTTDLSISPKHFERKNDGKDRFGNRLFVSGKYSYIDKNDHMVRAGILISPLGESLIKDNPGILKLIDFGLSKKQRKVSLGVNIELLYKIHGTQSLVFILKISGKSYAIKTPNVTEGDPGLGQPYINEMLQTQALASDLKSDLEKIGIQMQTFYFASGQVSCTQFEEDSLERLDDKDYQKLEQLWFLVTSYLNKQQIEGNELWKGIELDNPTNPSTAKRNFIKRKDGVLVWVDPFKFDRFSKEKGRRYID